ncbi:MFS transporter [Lysinibacillus fusiformis]|jgi:MFS family permease|uniref:MDR family MFS transporter n=1 Tax=Lysinibacillus TaxID=400634 RepID=UPI0004DAA0E3|nr:MULTISPECIES: MFS transporter [Lysinibacillus]MDC6268236.1 MFS transporter [Lysinibacillus sphaericus]AJK86727.1 multidrug MFS transporter [Lysinibacillus fusiformis]KAB0443093.1 MFS transporter [Lysinibacillus fusiformis]KGA81616.1 multidrug MFS transporter [Lysinibacillus fusiformis]KHK56783.1 multidrug MFS transporter [Lysinibacillus sp. A1]
MPKRVWFLIIGMLVNTTGNSFLWPLNAIYMHDYLGKTLAMAGFVLMLNSAAGVLGNLLGGYLFDRIGGYKAIMLGILLTIASLIGLTLWHGWPHYVWFLTILGFSGGIVFPSMFALAGAAWPEGGRKAFNAIYLAQNVGVAVGPALAGIVADYQFDYVFKVNLGMYILFFIIALLTFKRLEVGSIAPKNVVGESKRIINKAPFYALLIISSSSVLCWLAYSQWSATISSYTQDLGLGLKQYSLLWTINGLLIVIGQPLIAPLIKRWEHQLKRQLVFGVILIAISFGIIAFASDFKMFGVAMLVLTFGEMFYTPALPTIANQLAPKGRQGFYQGIINSAATGGRMIGPLFGGIMVDQYGMIPLVLTLVVIVLFAIIPCLIYDYPLKKNNIVVDS